MKIGKTLYSKTHVNNCEILSKIKERKILSNHWGTLIIECDNSEYNRNLLNKSTMSIKSINESKIIFVRG